MNDRRGGGGDNRGSARREEAEQRALTVIEPPRMPLPPRAQAEAHGLTTERWRALIDAVYPSAKTMSGVMLALDYCKARNLDPFKRVVHVVPMWNSKLGREVETVWPGIGELRTTASRTGQHAGNDDCSFGRVMRQAFRDSRSGSGNNGPYSTEASCPEMDFPEWAQITVYKLVAGQRVPFVGPKVYFVETFSGEKGLAVPNARWRRAPRQMLEKNAEAAALRRAFPEELGDQYAAEEMEGKAVPAAVAEAQYHYVNAEDADGGDAEPKQQQDRQDPPPGARELNGWNADALDRYVATMREFFGSVDSLDRLDSAVADESRRVDTLPPQEKLEAKQFEHAARDRLDRLSDAVSSEAIKDSASEQQQDRDLSPEPEQDRDEPAFVRNFRRRVDETVSIEDIDALARTERRAIEQRPAEEAQECETILARKRVALLG